MFEHAYERPLGPLVVVGGACTDFAVPVVAETNFIELLAVARYVHIGSLLGVLPCLDGILLGGESVCIISHWMKHIETLQTFITAIYVRSYITQRMSNMQTCP